MKIRPLVLILLASATVLFARIVVPYDFAKPPTLPLPSAYERALVAIGAATNQFHCISATITTDFSSQGGWFFTFCTTNKPVEHKWVTVDFDGAVHVEDKILNR
jgi:hypothetical protein